MKVWDILFLCFYYKSNKKKIIKVNLILEQQLASASISMNYGEIILFLEYVEVTAL